MRQVSERVLETDEPVIGKTKALIAGVEGVLSLAQGLQAAGGTQTCFAARHTVCIRNFSACAFSAKCSGKTLWRAVACSLHGWLSRLNA